MAKIAKRFAKANEAFVGKMNISVEEAVNRVGFGEILSTGTFQILAASSRSFAFVTSPWGSLCVRVPTSRTVPQALGWPVREKGLLPGLAILPTSR